MISAQDIAMISRNFEEDGRLDAMDTMFGSGATRTLIFGDSGAADSHMTEEEGKYARAAYRRGYDGYMDQYESMLARLG